MVRDCVTNGAPCPQAGCHVGIEAGDDFRRVVVADDGLRGGVLLAVQRGFRRAHGFAVRLAAGYVVKDIRGQTLVADIRRVARGERLLPGTMTARVVAHLAESLPDHQVELTLREEQVLELIAAGLTNRQIGERLGLAEKTIKNYVSALLAKLGMKRRTQAAVYGAQVRGPK
jgi:DNA-binding NarL/FixJ family response regulator